MDAMDEILTWQFWASCLFVQALVWVQRTVMAQLSPATGERPWWKAVLTISNVLWGIVVAWIPNYLKGDTFAERIVLGAGVGLVSQFVYHLVLKRWLDRLGPSAGNGNGKPGGQLPEQPSSERRTTAKDLPVQGP